MMAMIRNISLVLGIIVLFVACENDVKVVNALFNKRLGVDEATNITSYMSQGEG